VEALLVSCILDQYVGHVQSSFQCLRATLMRASPSSCIHEQVHQRADRPD
jgi:hypothetical protein